MSEVFWGDVVSLEVNWDEDPIILSGRFTEAALSLERNLDHPAVAARQIIIDDIKEHFEREEDPSGTTWQPWAPTYAPVAERENIGILRKSEDLYAAVTDITSWPVIGHDIWVNTNAWPDYWRIHQQGGVIGTARMHARKISKMRKNIEGWQGTGKIPQRAYVGISTAADDVIFGVYNFWFEGELRIIYSEMTGTAQFQMPSGRIGPRIGLRN